MSKRAKNIYLLVDSSDMLEVNYHIVAAEDRFKNLKKILKFPLNHSQVVCDYEKIDKYFSPSGIPSYFRKIVVILHKPFTSNKEAEEIFTGVPFDVSGYTRFVKDRSKQIISGRTYGNKSIMFAVRANFVDIDTIKNFYSSLKQNNLFEKYIFSLNCLLGVNYQIDEEMVEAKVRRLEL